MVRLVVVVQLVELQVGGGVVLVRSAQVSGVGAARRGSRGYLLLEPLVGIVLLLLLLLNLLLLLLLLV